MTRKDDFYPIGAHVNLRREHTIEYVSINGSILSKDTTEDHQEYVLTIWRVKNHTVADEGFGTILHHIEGKSGVTIKVTGRSLERIDTKHLVESIIGPITHTHTHTHTEACKKRLDLNERARGDFACAHPNYCPSCEGNSGFSYPATRHEPGGFDPCHLCVEQGYCPFCGSDMGEFGETCTACGWKPELNGMPQREDCTCPINFEE